MEHGYLALKETVRIVRFDNYLWVIEGMSGFKHIALPLEVALLCLCDGTTGRTDLYDATNVILGVGASEGAVQAIVDTVITKFAPTLAQFETPASRSLRYDFADYLYSVEPLERHPERLPAPVEALFTLTNKCNLRCVYCFNNSGSARTDELASAEWLELIAQADDIGVQKIHLSGGEPFAHQGAVAMLRELKRRDMLVEIATNGTWSYSTEVFDLLAGSRVDVSLDTIEEATYQRLTGSTALLKVIDNIRKFIAMGASVSVKVCVTRLNYQRIGDLYGLLADLGVADVGLAAYTTSPSGRGGDDLSLTEAMIAEVQDEYQRIEQTGQTRLIFGIPNPCWTTRDDVISCDGLSNTIIVMPNGDVTPCELITDTPELCFGNVRRSSLLGIWNGPLVGEFFRRKAHPQGNACADCGLVESCRTGCFAEKLYQATPLYGPDPRCGLARERTLSGTLLP